MENNLIKLYAENCNSAQNKETKIKIKNSRVKNGTWISDSMRNLYELYENKVDNLTKLNKKLLFENWNGYDYYDNEYILNNFQLNYIDVNYPTIVINYLNFMDFKIIYLLKI